MLKLHTTLVNKFHFEKYAPYVENTWMCKEKYFTLCKMWTLLAAAFSPETVHFKFTSRSSRK